jgi:hypothetical protein
MTGGNATGVIERVAWGDATGDEAIRQRCRTAPIEVRRLIDHSREARGLRPLWPGASRRGRTRTRAVATVARWRAFLTLAGSRYAGGSPG